MRSAIFEQFMNEHSEIQQDLFIRGFLITDKNIENLDRFPFYGNWKVQKENGYYFLSHKLTGCHLYKDKNGIVFFLMGHAYNPFIMEHDEKKILEDISLTYGTNKYFDKVNELTGIYVYGTVESGGKISYLVDASGMQSACYGKVKDYFYISSHAQLIGDICDLKMDPFVKELISYKWYGRVMGPYLPADLTPFEEVKRIVPSVNYSFDGIVRHKRFWMLEKFDSANDPEEYDNVIKTAADLLHNNMDLVIKKWDKPWISLTGGIDSNTTFAAGNGYYDKLEAFSYISAEKEIRDAEAAKKIAEHFNVKYHLYNIPDDDGEIKDFDYILEVLRHNNGYVAELKHNEARKRMYLKKNAGCDVEVKSWASETIRAYWYKHYGRKKMPDLSPKLYRNLYKIFTTNRTLAHKIDRLFEKYIKDFEYERIPSCYLPADVHYNEVTWGSWGGLNISEMKYCFDITIIYNNRKFFDLMFRVPLEKRISDQHHLDVKRHLNKELFDMNIRVVNMKETNFRAFALNLIFTINSIL